MPYQEASLVLQLAATRDNVVFRRASSTCLATHGERMNSVPTLRDAPPRCMSKVPKNRERGSPPRAKKLSPTNAFREREAFRQVVAVGLQQRLVTQIADIYLRSTVIIVGVLDRVQGTRSV